MIKVIILLFKNNLSKHDAFVFCVYRPAEWRWKMPHVCDDEWHHYAINVNFPEVRDKSPPITRCEYQQHFNLGNDHFKCESNVMFRM